MLALGQGVGRAVGQALGVGVGAGLVQHTLLPHQCVLQRLP